MINYITHIGVAVPENIIHQNEARDCLLKHAHLPPKSQAKLNKIFESTAIHTRYSVLDYIQNPEKYFTKTHSITQRMEWFEQYASELGIAAIKNSGIPQDVLHTVTHFITVSCTGMYAPGVDIEMMHACEIPAHAARTCIYFMGCAATFNALKTADAICHANPNARVLIVGIELCSLHFQTTPSDDEVVANALFSDGAACALVQNKSLPGKNLSLENFYSTIVTDKDKKMAWSIRSEGFLLKLSIFIPALLSAGIKELIQPLKAHYQFNFENIDYFAIHPGGPKILQKIEEILNIPPSKNAIAHEILRNYGNMSSTTILFILNRLLQQASQDTHGKTIFSMAFGPGLTVESGLFKIYIT